MRKLVCILCLLAALMAGQTYAQTTPKDAEKQIGNTPCSNDAASADFDAIAQCNGAGTPTFQRAPVFAGKVTSPPYTTTDCDSNKAGMVQWTGTEMQYCNGTAWTAISSGGASQITGEIVAWPTTTAPSGFLECDGSAVSRATYADLFAVLGTLYGVGDGSTTFNLPDLQGEFIRGWTNTDTTTPSDPDYASRTDRGDGTGGNVVGSKQASAFYQHNNHASTPGGYSINSAGDHSHTPNATSTFTSGTSAGSGTNFSKSNATSSGGGSHNHSFNFSAFNSGDAGSSTESRPRNVYVMYIIKY